MHNFTFCYFGKTPCSHLSHKGRKGNSRVIQYARCIIGIVILINHTSTKDILVSNLITISLLTTIKPKEVKKRRKSPSMNLLRLFKNCKLFQSAFFQDLFILNMCSLVILILFFRWTSQGTNTP